MIICSDTMSANTIYHFSDTVSIYEFKFFTWCVNADIRYICIEMRETFLYNRSVTFCEDKRGLDEWKTKNLYSSEI